MGYFFSENIPNSRSLTHLIYSSAWPHLQSLSFLCTICDFWLFVLQWGSAVSIVLLSVSWIGPGFSTTFSTISSTIVCCTTTLYCVSISSISISNSIAPFLLECTSLPKITVSKSWILRGTSRFQISKRPKILYLEMIRTFKLVRDRLFGQFPV